MQRHQEGHTLHGVEWLLVKTHLMTIFWLRGEVLEEDENGMEKTNGGWSVNSVTGAVSHYTRKGTWQMNSLGKWLRQRKYFFIALKSWNSLAWEVVEVRTVNSFKEWKSSFLEDRSLYTCSTEKSLNCQSAGARRGEQGQHLRYSCCFPSIQYELLLEYTTCWAQWAFSLTSYGTS